MMCQSKEEILSHTFLEQQQKLKNKTEKRERERETARAREEKAFAVNKR